MEKLTHILLIADGVEPGAKLLEKTVRLARRFGAHVELLLDEHGDSKGFASLCNERGYDEVILSSVFRGPACINDVVLRHVHERPTDLIVKAPAEGLDASTGHLSAADQELAAASPVPVCLMRARPWGQPVRIAAAVNIANDDAVLPRSIVHAAGFLNLGCEGELDVIYSEVERDDEVLRMARAVKLARVVREFHVSGERVRRLEGAPEETLPAIASAGGYDILILGAVTQREGLSRLRASLTRRLVSAFDGDVVLVKETAAAESKRERATLRSRATP
jgi:nucleotide-binding universal stress UspA family protein